MTYSNVKKWLIMNLVILVKEIVEILGNLGLVGKWRERESGAGECRTTNWQW